MDAAAIIQRIRSLTGITRKELALLAEVSPSTISRIERGELDPTWGTLCRILEAAGYRISGDSLVSAGDPSAIAAARSIVQSVLAEPSVEGSAEMSRWIDRWIRAGWLSTRTSADDLVTLAVSAGNAGKIARRNARRRSVVADEGWRPLARELGEAGVDYAISGLLAAREDRATAPSISPVIYVEDPDEAMEALDLKEARPGEGALLIASTNSELEGTETEDGIRFVPRALGVLDAFAGSGREPDKAEDTLRHLLAEVSPGEVGRAVEEWART